MRNAKVNATIKKVVYGITRRWGAPATIFRLLESVTDYATGDKTRTIESRGVRNVVALSDSQRRAIYETSAYTQSSRPFTWRGGQGADIHSRVFLILGTDLRDWKPDVHQWIKYEGLQYEIYNADRVGDFVGWMLSCRAAASSESGTVLPAEHEDNLSLTQESDES